MELANDLSGKTAVVTGAASGIGRATSEQLAEQGATVVGADIDGETVDQTMATIADGFEGSAIGIQTDVADQEQVDALVHETVDRFGGIDVLVNNAGKTILSSVEEMDTETYRQQMDVNVDGAFFVTRAALPHICESEGNLIFTGSVAGKYWNPSFPVYAASKWWIRGFAESLRAGVGVEENVAITVVNPSETRTEIADGFLKENFDEDEISSPEDVAKAIVFAAGQSSPNTVNEIDLFRRDKFADL